MTITNMKLVVGLYFIIIAFYSCAYADTNEQNEEAWKEYKTKFDKNYSTQEEDAQRMKIFLENKDYITSYNVKSKSASFTQGLNHLSDLTQDEINRSLNGFRLTKEPERHMDGILWTLISSLNDTLSAPTADRAWYENILSPPMLDYRTTGRVSRIKDQGSCGSCWAFACTGALESILAARNNGVLLSEQNLVDCSSRYGNYGCSGGLMDQGFNYVRDHGIMSQQDYPYTGKDESCKFIRSKSVTNVRNSVILPPGNEPLLRMVLAMTGPIPIAIDASSKSFHSYKSGVYNDRSCRSSSNSLNHAVLLVGYGTDKNYGDYWIIKNSWGLKWGNNGYIKLARNSRNLCGVSTYAVLPIP